MYQTPIAKILEERAFLIADPQTKWVQRYPQDKNSECCLIVGQGADEVIYFYNQAWYVKGSIIAHYLTDEGWLDADIEYDFKPAFVRAGGWNDYKGRTRQQVVDMLLNAADEAAEDGV